MFLFVHFFTYAYCQVTEGEANLMEVEPRKKVKSDYGILLTVPKYLASVDPAILLPPCAGTARRPLMPDHVICIEEQIQRNPLVTPIPMDCGLVVHQCIFLDTTTLLAGKPTAPELSEFLRRQIAGMNL